MREIPLTRGKVAIVDDDDFEELSRHRWHAVPGRYTWYAMRRVTIASRPQKQRGIPMHRQVLGVTDSRIHVDHVDGNGLDNRRSNLRPATHSTNQRNAAKQRGRSSRYKGVCWSKKLGKWQASICLGTRQLHLGVFTDEKEAAEVYDSAALEYFGSFARLNFPADGAAA